MNERENEKKWQNEIERKKERKEVAQERSDGQV